MKGFYLTELLAVLALLAMFAAGLSIPKYKCEQGWKDSGMPYKWGIIGGCRIQQPDGTWIPARNYRVITKE